jgi:WD40 repeat protein
LFSFSSGTFPVNSLDTNQSIAAAIRDTLAQHADIFSTIGPAEVCGQLIARLGAGGSAIESYLRLLEQSLEEGRAIVPARASFVRDPANLRTLRGHSREVIGVVALDGNRALSASADHSLRLWDLTTGETMRVLEGHKDRVTDVLALEHERALSTSYDHTLRLWDLQTGKSIHVLEGHSGPINHVGRGRR